jgi:hypothetical protein
LASPKGKKDGETDVFVFVFCRCLSAGPAAPRREAVPFLFGCKIRCCVPSRQSLFLGIRKRERVILKWNGPITRSERFLRRGADATRRCQYCRRFCRLSFFEKNIL